MQVSRKLCNLVLTSLIVFSIGHECLADSVVFSNLGTGGSVYGADGWTIEGATAPNSQGLENAQAETFTPTSTTNFTELNIALGYVVGTNSLTVDLMSDSGGLPGTVLESWNVSGLPAFGTCCTVTALSGNGTIALDSGTAYWVAVFPGDDSTYATWDLNTTGDGAIFFKNFGSGWFSYSGGPGAPEGAYEVQGEASTVPEPGTMSLLGSGLALLAGIARRKLGPDYRKMKGRL